MSHADTATARTGYGRTSSSLTPDAANVAHGGQLSRSTTEARARAKVKADPRNQKQNNKLLGWKHHQALAS